MPIDKSEYMQGEWRVHFDPSDDAVLLVRGTSKADAEGELPGGFYTLDRIQIADMVDEGPASKQFVDCASIAHEFSAAPEMRIALMLALPVVDDPEIRNVIETALAKASGMRGIGGVYESDAAEEDD